MGIAYYYSGDADRALKEFDQALKDDPRHVQTLFNVGVVKMNGKNDPKGAIAAWESLLKIDPQYQDRAKVESHAGRGPGTRRSRAVAGFKVSQVSKRFKVEPRRKNRGLLRGLLRRSAATSESPAGWDACHT